MASIKVFAACRMRAFAAMVAQQFGVQVRLRGKEIKVQYSKPPIIFLPALEYGNDKDLLPIYGFCLHEAAHLKYTRQNVARKCKNYLQKMLHNAIEDVYIERRLESDFPGARELLLRSYTDGIKQVLGEKPIVEPISYLAPEADARVTEIMASLGMNISDETLRSEMVKRMEIERVARLWIIQSRQYPLPLYDWPAHQWHEVFQQEAMPWARSTGETYAQAERIIARLNIKPILPGDVRPIAMIEDAKAKRAAVRAVKEAIRELIRSRKAKIDKQMSRTLEHQTLHDSKDSVNTAAGALEEAERTAIIDQSDGAQKQIEAAEVQLAEARKRESDAQRRYEDRLNEVRREVSERCEPAIRKERDELREKSKVAAEAMMEAKKAEADIALKDAKADEPIREGFLRELAESVFKSYQAESTDDELKRVLCKEDKGQKLAPVVDPTLAQAGKYTVFDRSLDRVESVTATPAATADYARTRRLHLKTIADATERLRRLHDPKLASLKTNADAGRLDPRKAYRVGLAMRGVAVEVDKVWRRVDEKPDRNVAVSLLIDCSGSMRAIGPCGKSRIDLARESATVLSEVLSALGVAHEIVGHTTDCEEGVDEDVIAFSRCVPFRGYMFKKFEEKSAPASLFSPVDQLDNLDGEALLWAADRLASRHEKSKFLVVISDGLPAAEGSRCDELERHLLCMARQIEAHESDGLHLHAIGIGEERVRKFYKNAVVIPTAGDLPNVLMELVERLIAVRRGS